MAKIWRGGWSTVHYSANALFSTFKEITPLLKEATGIEFETPTEEFADGKEGMAGKSARVSIRSADMTADVYADLKTAEENGTKMHFRFVGIQGEQIIEDCEDPWNESVDAEVTSEIDAADKVVGANSVKLTVAVGAEAGDILATEAIGPLNLTTRKDVTLYAKSSVNLDAGDLQLLLDDTASCASPLELLDLPALTANEWTPITLVLDDPSLLNAIISVGVKMVVDKGAFVLRLDHVVALANNMIVKNVEPVVQPDLKQTGAYNAQKVTGKGYATTEAGLISETV